MDRGGIAGAEVDRGRRRLGKSGDAGAAAFADVVDIDRDREDGVSPRGGGIHGGGAGKRAGGTGFRGDAAMQGAVGNAGRARAEESRGRVVRDAG